MTSGPYRTFTAQSSAPVPTLPGRSRAVLRSIGNSWWKFIIWALVTAMLVLSLGLLGTAWVALRRVSNRLERIPEVFAIPESTRPQRAPGTAHSMNLLIAGLDGDARTRVERGARSDAVMVLHLDANRKAAWLVSIPRDSWVPIPGRGANRINAAYSLGGPALFVQTVEQLTGLRMDHLVVIDWTGLKRLTDAVGGVPLSLTEASAAGASGQPGVALAMDGGEALAYMSERKHLPAGDLDRVKRQQHYLRALLAQAMSQHTLAEPAALRALAAAIGDAVRVDAGLTTGELLALVTSVRNMRLEDVTFLTAPTSGPEMRGDASVVVYDANRGHALWSAMANDRMPGFAAANRRLVTPLSVR